MMNLQKICGLRYCVHKLFGLLNSDSLTDLALDELVNLSSGLFKVSLCAFYLHCSLCRMGRGGGGISPLLCSFTIF